MLHEGITETAAIQESQLRKFQNIEFGRDYGAAHAQDYTDNRYHQPSDEYRASCDLSGAAEDLRLYFDIGQRLANGQTFPERYDDNEFKAIRDVSSALRLRTDSQ